MKKFIISALILFATSLQTMWAQGFRVYNSDGTVMQFSLRTDSIVFYDGIGSEQDLGPFTPINNFIVGTWYKSKSESITFNEDGSTDYMDGATYKFFPYLGTILFYNAYGGPVNIYKVYELTADRMLIGDVDGKWNKDGNFLVMSRTPIQHITRIELNRSNINLLPDETFRLIATVYPDDADNPAVTWESSDETVAIVINQGLVVGVGNGTCTITCRATDGNGVHAECEVTCGSYFSYCPTWRGFTYYTGNYPDYVQGRVGNVYLNPGDSIHITAHQDKKGHLINGTFYTWTLCVDTLVDAKDIDDPNDDVIVHANIVYNQHTNYDGYDDGANDPVCHMKIPASARRDKLGHPDTIKFVARYIYSGQGVIVETDNIIDNTNYNGRITPQSGPTGGGAAGNFYFNVNAN